MARQLTDWLTEYMKFTENSEPPDSFRLWTGISVIAASLKRKCSLQWGSSPLFPNMYIILVGPSGCRKGTAMGPGYNMLRKLGIKMAAEATTREALIKTVKESTDVVAASDGSAVYNHCSLTVFSQELTVFLGYNNMQLMADLCDWFDCRDLWIYRTKNSGTDEIIGVWVNLMGATTPDLLASTLPRDAIGGGLTARMIMIYAARKGKIIAVPHQTEAEKRLGETLQNDLEKISMLSGEFKISDDFLDVYIPWYVEQNHNPPIDDTRFTGYVERRGMHVLKLSMICSASRDDSMTINAKDLSRAIKMLEDVEKNMPYIFQGVGKSNTGDILTGVMRHCMTKGSCTLSDLLNMFYQDADRRIMIGILQTLEGMKTVSLMETPNDLLITYIGKKEEVHG